MTAKILHLHIHLEKNLNMRGGGGENDPFLKKTSTIYWYRNTLVEQLITLIKQSQCLKSIKLKIGI